MPAFVSALTRSIAALGAVFFATVGLSACGGIPGDAVVQVGGTSITKNTFNHWLGIAASSNSSTPGQKPATPIPPDFKACVAQLQATAPKPAKGQPAPSVAQFKTQCQQEYNSLRDQVLQFLISADWVLGESSDQHVSVTDKAVMTQFNTIKAQQFPKPGAFQAFLTQSGQTLPDLLLRVKLDLLSTKLRDKVTKAKATVTPAQINTYYNTNKSRFAQPERRDLRIILVKTQGEANSAKAQIVHGQSFASVAKKVSIDQATKAQGGALLGVQRGQEEKALDDAIFGAQLHTLSGPIKTQFGYYVFQVQKVTPASQQTLAAATPTIKQQLLATQQQTALDTFVKTFQKKWTAKTNCRAGYVVMDCKTYKAPKTTGVPGAPTTAPQGTTTAPQGTVSTSAAPPPTATAPATTSTTGK
jgi:foldase protein PrsA